MAAIAGIFDLSGTEPLPPSALRLMADALGHRSPNPATFHEGPGVGLTYRGRCPTATGGPHGPSTSENGAVRVVCHGRFYNRAELHHHLTARGRRPQSACEAELIAHLWEEQGTALIERLRGQFAFALWDRRRGLVLGRDRVGISPLYWARRGPWLLFASEIKALLASGLVRPEPDHRGIDHVFTFLGMPAARTCFAGVQALLPGHYLQARSGQGADGIEIQRWWDLDFPDRGQERNPRDARALTDELQTTLQSAVDRRLDADPLVASYVSGGIDCSTLAALGAKTRGAPLATFTIRLAAPTHDESARARRAAQAGGSEPTVLTITGGDVLDAFPRLIRAAEHPVPDTSCASLLLLAGRVQQAGYQAALAGDGADDLFAGYPWFKIHRLLGLFDWLPGLRPSQWLRRGYLRWTAPHIPWANVRRIQSLVGGHHAWNDLYGLVSLSRSRFYSPAMWDALDGHIAYEDLALDLDRMRRWHPVNQGLYLGMKMHVPGLLLQAKGDRIAMQSGVELRYPFLDEDVLAFSASLHPCWKLRRLRDKYLLRRVAERLLPADIAWRPKSDFVAPFDSLFSDSAPRFFNELLSEESLRRTGYFDPAAVHVWRTRYPTLRAGSGTRVSVEIGLAAVVATQLWHHLFLDAGLADLPTPSADALCAGTSPQSAE